MPNYAADIERDFGLSFAGEGLGEAGQSEGRIA